MVQLTPIAATFRSSWNLRCDVLGDPSDLDESADGVFDPDHRVRIGVLHFIIECRFSNVVYLLHLYRCPRLVVLIT